MNPIPRVASFLSATAAVAALALAHSAAPAQGSPQLLWSTPWSNYTAIPSRVFTSPASDLEAADDFDVQGTITRVVFDASGCFNCAPPTVTGATVRFYQWANGLPGQLQQETFVPNGSPGLLYNPLEPESVEVTLPAPFFATGRHFVSMQLHFQPAGTWDVWVSGVGSYQLAPTRVRNRLTNSPWAIPPVNSAIPTPLYCDLTFQLFGQAAGSSGPPWLPCITWSELPTTSPAGASYSLLRAIKAFAPDDVWAAGSMLVQQAGNIDQLTVTMHWNGIAWAQVPSPSPTPAPGLTNCMLYGMDGVASDDLWAAGTYQRQVNGGWVGQQVFAMHWDGSSWTVPPGLPVPNTSVGAGISGSKITDVHATASDDVWFVGDWLDIVSASSGQSTRPGFLMRWNGSNLEQTVLPIVTNVAHQYFNSVAAIGPDDVWVAGGAGVVANLPGSPVPVLFHFDGSNWTHTPCPTPNHPGWSINLYHVEMLASNDVWVAGISSTQLPTLQSERFLAHWDGANWSLLPGPPFAGAMTIVSAAEMYSVGSTVWFFDGIAWTQTQAFTAQIGAGLGAVDALGPCEVFAVGGQTRIGQIAPFAARLDAPQYWRSNVRMPTQPQRAPGTLTTVSPPHLGSQLRVAIDDPAGAVGVPQAATLWVLAAAPAPGYPAPVPVPFGGTNGGPGDLFVDLLTAVFAAPVAWTAGGGPAVHSVMIPNQLSLIGVDLFTQGVLLGLGGPLQLVFTNGLDLHVGW